MLLLRKHIVLLLERLKTFLLPIKGQDLPFLGQGPSQPYILCDLEKACQYRRSGRANEAMAGHSMLMATGIKSERVSDIASGRRGGKSRYDDDSPSYVAENT